jgi:hypothetical protein
MTQTNATVPAHIDRLRGDDAESRAAWLEIRERLHRDPGRWAAPLCSFLAASLEAGATLPVRASILPALEVCTRDRSDLLSAGLLDRLLGKAAELDTLSVLCLGLMRVRADAEGLFTDGIQEVLAATEHALSSDVDAQREVQDYARDMAVELWELVAERDPSALMVVLEFWTAAHGWNRRTTRLLLDRLLRAAPQRPELREALIAALEPVRSRLVAVRADASAVAGPLDELRQLRERAERRARAESIAAGLSPSTDAEGKAAVTGEPAEAQLEPEIARWKDDYLSDDPNRSFAAREPLAPGDGPPTAGLVAGAILAADALLRTDPYDDRFGPLVNFVCRTAESRPDLVPTGVLERWTAVEGLEEWERAMIFATLAQHEPRAILGGRLEDALGAAAAAGGGFGSAILTGIGRVEPDLLLDFGRRWLQTEGWTAEFGPALACAFEQLAQERPDRRDAIVHVLQARGVPQAESTDGFAEVTRCIDRIARLQVSGRD